MSPQAIDALAVDDARRCKDQDSGQQEENDPEQRRFSRPRLFPRRSAPFKKCVEDARSASAASSATHADGKEFTILLPHFDFPAEAVRAFVCHGQLHILRCALNFGHTRAVPLSTMAQLISRFLSLRQMAVMRL